MTLIGQRTGRWFGSLWLIVNFFVVIVSYHWYCNVTYLAWIAASTSTVSWLSNARLIAWCTCSFSGIMQATEPSVRRVNDLATGSFECITVKMRLTNSSTFVIFSRCFSLCWHTRRTQSRKRFDPAERKNSANLRKLELITMGKGYFSKSLGNLTMASHCSPMFCDLRPKICSEKN